MNNPIVEFWRTKNHYKVLDSNAKFKMGPDWVSCVIYQDYKHINEKGEYEELIVKRLWVRESKEFWSKFDLVLDL